jgi:hypothetical protein
MTGILQVKGETFLLTDATTNVTAELRGTALAKYAGKKVSVTGSIIGNAVPAAGASQVIQVTAIDAASGGKRAAGAAGAGAAGAATGGLSAGATAAIVAGVGVTGAVAGLALTGTFSGASAASR